MPGDETTTPRPPLVRVGPLGIRAKTLEKLQPVRNPEIVKIEGITGIFTPLTEKGTAALTKDERKNYEVMVDHLKNEVNELQTEKMALSRQLEVLKVPPSSPEDFATAIQQSVDELQQKLTTMKNPVSSFALKNFRLEANVLIEVSRLGTIEYRFIRANDPVDPNSISRITMELVPVPKADRDHTWTPDLFQPGIGIGQLPEISLEQCRILETNHIFTIGEFLQVGTRVRAAAQLVALLGVERAKLASWLNQAELLTLKGTNGETALVLIAAGFTSLGDIASATPEALLSAYLAKRTEMRRPKALEATLDQVAVWIEAAQRYLGYSRV